MLKVSPRKGVIRFGKQGKLNPRYIGSFKILGRIGLVAYKLELSKELSNVHKEPVEIMDREIKQLRQSRIPIVKVRWNSKRGPEFTWEREDKIHAKDCYAAMQSGLDMQHLGALLLELGRTMLTFRVGQSYAASSVYDGLAVYISLSGPNPIMVQNDLRRPIPSAIHPLIVDPKKAPPKHAIPLQISWGGVVGFLGGEKTGFRGC
nr:putative reverse transcriptase domain-containing protein [Tanacetum cinerariifolium]